MMKRTMKKNLSHIPVVEIALGRQELNVLMYSFEANRHAHEGELEDKSIDLQDKFLKKGRFKEKEGNELVSFQFTSQEVVELLQQFVGASILLTEGNDEVVDFFESIKQEKLEEKKK